jgi:N-ethylmaleimide reductase
MKLLKPATIGPFQLKNRMVMAPMTRSRATADHTPQSPMDTYYRQRAGAGLIITEGTAPSPNGVGYPRIPGIYNQEQTNAWKAVTAAVHAEGGKIFIQLMHTGRVSHPDNLPAGAQLLAPSAVALTQTEMYSDQAGGNLPIPTAREMSPAQVQEAIQEYITASENAIAAGFDGVELHAANGYLIEQFIHPGTNQRTDEYGGSMENRCRFAIEVAQRVADAIGKDKVGIRVSPYGAFNEMGAFEEVEETYRYLAEELSKIGILYIHTVDHSAMGAPAVPDSVKNAIRNAFDGAIILSGGYDKDRAEQDLAAGKGELVAFGRPFLANPDLPQRYAQDAPLNDPDFGTFYTPGEKGYTDYPNL